MATKKVKKLAFGGMSNAVRSAANKAAAQVPAKTGMMPRFAKPYANGLLGGTPDSRTNQKKMAAIKADNERMAKATGNEAREIARTTLGSNLPPNIVKLQKRGVQGLGLGAKAAEAMQAQLDARNNATMQKRMPVNDFLKRNNAPSMEKLNAAKQAMLGNQPGQKQVGGLKPYTSDMGAAVLKSLKPSGPSLGSGPMAKSNPLQKIGSGPSRQAMMKKGGMTKGYAAGGMSMVDKEKNPGLAKLPTEVRNKMGYMKKGGMAECKTVAKKEVKSHEKRMHGMAKGGSIDGCAIRGKTKTSMVKMKRGGSC
jgi:hypothetical protein